MSLKLIRKAQIATTTSKDILVAEHVREVLHKLGINESSMGGPSMDVSPADYDRWMGVVQDVAAESNVTITKKTQLADIAMSVLDNDPKIESQPGDKESLKSQIVDNMWNAFKASVGHGRLTTSVKKAREEEESGFIQDFRAAKGAEEEQRSAPLVKAALGGGNTNPFRPGSLRFTLWNQMHGVAGAEEEEEDFDAMPSDEMSDEASVEDRDPEAGAEDDMTAEKPMGDEDLDAEAPPEEEDPELEDDTEDAGDPDDLLASLSTDELEAELARRQEEEGGDEEAVDGEEPIDGEEPVEGDDAELPPEEGLEDDAAPEEDVRSESAEPVDAIAKRVFDDEESTKNFFRTAITRPSEELKAAVMDVEKEGESAWGKLELPKNPHPKKSQAYKAWEKGFKNIAKAALGIKDPKPAITSKAKPRRR